MTHTRNVFRFAFLALGLLAILLVQGARVTYAAPPTDLFFSEYLESTPGNRKAVEIYNGTASAITLTGTYNVVIYSNGSGTPGTAINLTGSIPAGGVFVLAHTDTPAAIGITADQTSSSLTFNGNDVVALRSGTTLVDVIGQIGNDPGAGGWGTDPANTTDNTIRRKSTICAGDANGTDAFDPATEWDGYANGTADGFGSHTTTCAGDAPPSVSSTTPADNATGVAANTNITITFSEAVNITGTISVVGGSSGPQNLTPTGGPTTFTLDPTDFTAGETVTVTIDDLQVEDQDVTDPPGNMAADFVFDFTILVPPSICGDPATLIHDVQGNGASSPIDGSSVTVEGIVVGDFQDTTADPPNELNGYFLQEEDADIDADPITSEGIFVFEGANPTTPAVAVGDKVRITGTVDEFGDAPDTYTEIVGPLTVQVCSTGNTAPTPASIDLPVSSLSDYEKYESMSVSFVDELTVTEVFTLGRFGEVLLAAGGRLWIPTHEADTGAPAAAVEAANILRSITLDDGLTNQNPDPLRYPEPGGLSATNTLRGGDTTTGLTGVLHYLDATEDFRVQPTNTITWNHVNPRPTDAPDVGGTLKVVGSNTLNYFPTLDLGPDICGPLNNQECRGADSAQEFTRQHDKLINMLLELNADIVGLNELENNSGANPANDDNDLVLESIVDALNAVLGAGTYDFIDTGTIGGDAIKVGLIYKPGSVTPVGGFEILDSSYDPAFIDTRSRPVLAQAFEDNNGELFTVAVAHLKSKGSACGGAPDDQPDSGGGNCNGTRTAAAEVMVDWFTNVLATVDPDILLVGDLNSYVQEDPIDVFINAGYVDLAAEFNMDPYSYVFDGEWGYLDYALASPSMAAQVNDATEWHINADEPIVLDYNTEFKSAGQITSFYDPAAFRVSDHDPMLVGLSLDTTAPDVTINQAGTQSDPTSTSPINFTVVFNEPVTGFATGDVTLGGTAGATTAVVTEIAPMDGTTYNVAVSGMTTSGTVIASIDANKAQDAAANGNTASTSTDNTVTYNVPDTTAPTVTINQAGTQSDPTSTSPINFTVVFSEPVTGFGAGDVDLSGTAGATTFVITEIAPMDGTTYNVAVSGMTGDGTVIATVLSNSVQDGAANFNNASTSTDNTVTYVVPVATEDVYVSTTAAGSAGAISFGSEDILKWDGSAWSVWFDGSAAGLDATIRAKHNINAFSIPDTAGDDVIISFTQNRRTIPGITPKVDGMDLVKWDGAAFSLYFDGSDVGLTVLTQEKIDGLHVMPATYTPPNAWTCEAYMLISTQGPGKVPAYGGGTLKFGGEDVLGFCATSLGSVTTGYWHMVLDGSAQGMPYNSTDSISASDDGLTIYLTTQKVFNVDAAAGGHSMVYAYDTVTESFSGPLFSAPANGLAPKVDGLQYEVP